MYKGIRLKHSLPILNGMRAYSSTKPALDPWFQKSSYSWFLPVQTRWKDNDQYGHMNNAVYHTLFELIIDMYLRKHVGMDPQKSCTPLDYTMTGNCTFLGSAQYPDVYLAGLGIQKIGNTSLTYKLSLFPLKQEEEELLVNLTKGHFYNESVVDKFAEQGLVLGDQVHVFVDPETKRPTPLPKTWIPELEKLLQRQN